MSNYPNIPGHTIKKCIGKGGMGEVYLGVQQSLGRSVALKVTLATLAEQDPNFAERFVREAKTTGRLRHPNIITVYDTGEVGDRCFMTMEYIDGGSLKAKIKSGTLDEEQILIIAKGVCAGLGHAHKAGFVHRDIKPENILLTVDGIPVVMDFGIVKILQSDIDLTGTHAVGSPKYMSPEQLMGDSLIDGRADLYSLGVVLFEMLEGRPPFNAEAAYAIGVKHLNEDPPDLSPRNMRFQRVVARLLEKDRDDRYRTADELMQALNGLDVEEAGEAIDRTPPSSKPALEPALRVNSDDEKTGLRAPRQFAQAQSETPPRRPTLNDVSNPGLASSAASRVHKSNLRRESRPFEAAGQRARGPSLLSRLFSLRAFVVVVLLAGFVAIPIIWPDITMNTLHLEAKAYFGSPVQKFRMAMELAERNNLNRSRFWLSEASKAGLPGAGYELGVSYRYVDEEKAVQALQAELDNMSHGSEDRDAALLQGTLLCNRQSFEDCGRAINVLEALVAESGSQKAMYKLAEFHHSRMEPPDYETARSWAELTIEREEGGPPSTRESEKAMLLIAGMYEDGQGVARRPKQATTWIVRAAQGTVALGSTRREAERRCGNSSQRSAACDDFSP